MCSIRRGKQNTRQKKQDVVEKLYLNDWLHWGGRQFEEPQAVQPHLALWKDHGAHPPGFHFQWQKRTKR